MKRFLLLLFAASLLFGIASRPVKAVAFVAPPPLIAGLREDSACQGDTNSCVCPPDGSGPASCNDPSADACTNQNCGIVEQYINPGIKVFSIIAGVMVAIGIMIGGIQYSSSGGDPQKAANAKRHIRNAIIALIAYFFLYAFLKFLIPGNSIIAG